MCVDSKLIYMVIIKYRVLILRLDDIMIRQGNEWKITFQTPNGFYEYLVLPFELSNALNTFITLMNIITKPFIGQFLMVHFKDILVCYRDDESYFHHL